MAVDTTVQVVMPAMGDSVSEGTILEWHKKEGDPASEGDTVTVGALLAEIAPGGGDGNGAAPATQEAETPAAPAAEESAGQAVEITMPAMGESVSEGVILEWAKQPGDAVEEDETIVEISTDKVDAEVPAPASGVMEEILANPGDTVTVGQVIGRMTSGGNGAEPAAATPEAPVKRAEPEEQQE